MDRLKATVCELGNRPEELAEGWAGLVRHVRGAGSELVLLPEMIFAPWFAAEREFRPAVWAAAEAAHERWLARLPELGALVVLGSRPVTLGGRRLNQGFVWTAEAGLRPAHEKYYLPDEPGFWEASWYQRGDGAFRPAVAGGAAVGFLICSDLWFLERARAYGRARAPFIRTGWGLSRQLRGGMAMRTIALLPALVGALAKGGGGIARSSGAAAPLNLAGLTRPDLAPPGGRVVNMVQLGDALTALADPPIKYLHVYLSNPAVVAPDSNRVLAGLAREDLFTVVQEQFATDTARYADLVLPSRSFAELSDLYRSYGHHCLQLARPVIPPVGQSRSLLAVFQELARRLGFTEEVFSQDEDAIIAGLLRQDSPFLAGITPADLAGGRPAGLKVPANPYAQGFLTPSGKVEFYSESLARRGLDPLPDGTPSLDEEGRGRYPLQLITPPKHEFLNSSFNEIPELVAKAGPASLLIHPVDAACRGVAEGALVRVRNDRGDCLLHARLTEDTRPGLVVAEGLYWPGHTPGGKGINRLTSQRLGDMGQTCAFHCNLVEVEPAPA